MIPVECTVHFFFKVFKNAYLNVKNYICLFVMFPYKYHFFKYVSYCKDNFISNLKRPFYKTKQNVMK